MRTLEDLLHEEIDKLEELSKRDVGLTGTPSGFTDLDNLTGGFQPGNLIVLAARPVDGQVVARHQHRRERGGRPRQARGAVLARDVGDRARTPLHRLPGKGLERRAAQGPGQGRPLAEGAQGVEKLAKAPLYVDDSSDIGILEIRAKARRLHAKHELGLIIVDYLQLLRPEGPAMQPGRASRPDEPGPEDPGARARDPGDRGLAALPRGGVTQPAESRCCRTCVRAGRSSRTQTS